MDYRHYNNLLATHLKNIYDGVQVGWSWGYERLDSGIGLIEPGQVVTVGAYSGIGKSYFAANVLDNFLTAKSKAKIIIYTAEMTVQDYIKRQVFLRAGLWERDYVSEPKAYFNKIQKVAAEVMAELSLADIVIFGPVFDWYEIKAHIIQHKPDIFFIDFVQQLNAGKVTRVDEAMPLIAKEILEVCTKQNNSGIVLAQVTNQSMSRKESRADVILSNIDFGKELYRISHKVLTLERKKNENGDGRLSKTLTVFVDKSRTGDMGFIEFDIEKGYKLCEKL